MSISIPTQTVAYNRLIELVMELKGTDRLYTQELVELAVSRAVPVGQREHLPVYIVPAVLDHIVGRIDSDRERMVEGFDLTASEHPTEECGECFGAAHQAVTHARVMGSTGSTYVIESADAKHGATVTREA